MNATETDKLAEGLRPSKKTELQKAVAKAKREKLENKFQYLWGALEGPPLVREHAFASERKWRFDFATWNNNFALAIECEGGSWVNGAHTRGAHFQSDCEKYFAATMAGWFIVRLTDKMLTREYLEPLIAFVNRRMK